MAFGVMNGQETQSVIALLRAREHARAVVAIRRFTGCGLQEAIRVLRALEKEFGLTELDQNLKRLLPETGLPSMLQVVHLAWK